MHKGLIYSLTLALLIPRACLQGTASSLDSDLQFCQKRFGELLESFVLTSRLNFTSETVPRTQIEADPVVLGAYLNNNLHGFVFKRNEDMVVWIALFGFLGTLLVASCAFIARRVWKKEKILLNETQLQKLKTDSQAKKKAKREAREANLAPEKHQIHSESRENKKIDKLSKGEKRSNSADFGNFLTSDEEEVQEIVDANNPHHLEYKLLLFSKLAFIFFVAVSFGLNKAQYDKFSEKYLSLSCKFVQTSQILLNGPQTQNGQIEFVGTKNLKNLMETARTSLAETSTGNILASINQIQAKIEKFIEGLENVYHKYLGRMVANPATGALKTIPFFSEWGPTTEFDQSTGLLANYSKTVRNRYGRLSEALEEIKNSMLAPITHSFYQKPKNESFSYIKAGESIETLDAFQTSFQAFYTKISTSYFKTIFQLENRGSTKIALLAYFSIILTLLAIFGLEYAFFKHRDRRSLKICLNVTWAVSALTVMSVLYFISTLVPLTKAMIDLGAITEPLCFNQTEFLKLDRPESPIRARMYSCLFQNGQLLPQHTFGAVIEATNALNSSLHTAIDLSTASNLTSVLSDFQGLVQAIDDFGAFKSLIYNPNTQENPNELLSKLNSMTDCRSPSYQKYGFDISYQTDCAALGGVCQSTDLWVWKEADCPSDTLKWVQGAPVNTAQRYCLDLSQNYANEPAVHGRYPFQCVEAKSGQSYKSEATSLLGSLSSHRAGVAQQASLIKTDLEALGSPDTVSFISGLNAEIGQNLNSELKKMGEDLRGVIDGALGGFGGASNCSFVKPRLLEMRREMGEVQYEFELFCYLCMGSLILIQITVILTFLAGNCFPRIQAKTVLVKDKNKVAATAANRVVDVHLIKDQRKNNQKMENSLLFSQREERVVNSSSPENKEEEAESGEVKVDQKRREDTETEQLVFLEDLVAENEDLKKRSAEKSTKAKSSKKKRTSLELILGDGEPVNGPKFVARNPLGRAVDRKKSRSISIFKTRGLRKGTKLSSGNQSEASNLSSGRLSGQRKASRKESGKPWKQIDTINEEFVESLRKDGLV